MKDDARVTVVYNFIMRSNMGFKQIYDGIITKFKEKRNIKKLVFNYWYMNKDINWFFYGKGRS